MSTRLPNLVGWSTDQLFAEVLDRSAGDRPALNHIQAMIMRALLDDCDEKVDAHENRQSLSGHAEAPLR